MNPITREEQYLQGAVNAANGQEVGDLPEPVTREEKYLKALIGALSNANVLNVALTSSDSGFVSNKDIGTIYDAFKKGIPVFINFSLSQYPGYKYSALVSIGATSDDYYSLFATAIDPFSNSIMSIYAEPQYSDGNEWNMQVYSL